MRIETASVDTGTPRRDEHLRSADFFDAEHHPEIVYRATRGRPLGGTRYRVEGELTIRGVTPPVVLDAEPTGIQEGAGGTRVGLSATGAIDRTEFGLNRNQALEAGGVLASNHVRLEIDLEALRVAVTAAA